MLLTALSRYEVESLHSGLPTCPTLPEVEEAAGLVLSSQRKTKGNTGEAGRTKHEGEAERVGEVLWQETMRGLGGQQRGSGDQGNTQQHQNVTAPSQLQTGCVGGERQTPDAPCVCLWGSGGLGWEDSCHCRLAPHPISCWDMQVP